MLMLHGKCCSLSHTAKAVFTLKAIDRAHKFTQATKGETEEMQAIGNGEEEPRRAFLNVRTLIRASYLVLGVLLVITVWLSTQFRTAARWRMSPAYMVLQERDKQLAEIRKYVYQGINATRDYLVNNHPNSDDAYSQELRRAKSSSTKSFLALNEWSAQQPALAQLDRDLAAMWTLLDQDRLATSKAKSEQGYDYLHSRLFPIRNDVINNLKALTEDIGQDRAALAALFAEERNRELTEIFSVMGAIIAISLLMASGNQKYRRTSQLESRLKFEEMARARDSLEQLSGRLLRIQEEERRKISRELHDGIGQTLTALRVEIHQVHFAATGGAPNGEERLSRARKLAEEAVRTVKDISLLLRPPLLDDLGLEPALAWLADQFSRRTGIQCRLRTEGLQEQLPDDLKTCVFRVIQEALHNCEKHASPTRIEIAVEQKGDTLTICVEDDGAGFALNNNNTPARHAGLGILGMRERAVLLGGTLAIRSSPGMGTKLSLTLPIARVGAAIMLAPAPVATTRV
jgi:signal transduction histidine kinase